MSRAGTRVTEKTIIGVPAFFRALMNICNHLAMMPIHVVEMVGEDKRKKHHLHPVSWALNTRANPESKAFDMRSAWYANTALFGNGYLVAERTVDGQDLVNLWNVFSRRMTQKRRNTYGELYYQHSLPDGRTEDFEEEEILKLCGLSFDGVQGISLVDTIAKENFGLAIAIQDYAAAYFGNGTMLGNVITSTLPTTADQRKEAVAEIEKLTKGPEKAYKTIFVAGGAKIEKIGDNFESSKAIENMTMSIQDAARWLNVPPAMLHEHSRSTFNNVEELEKWYRDYSLMPWVVPLEQECNYKLFVGNERGPFKVKVNMDAILRGNPESRARFYTQMWGIGAYSTNDVLATEDRDGIGKKGDTRYVPGNYAILGEPTPVDRRRLESDKTRSTDKDAGEKGLINYALAKHMRKAIKAVERCEKAADPVAAKAEFFKQFRIELHEACLEIHQTFHGCEIDDTRSLDLLVAIDAIEQASYVSLDLLNIRVRECSAAMAQIIWLQPEVLTTTEEK